MDTINNSPVLKLSDIIVQLFNNELLADIVFTCDDQVIHGHSLLLMARSVVYESELKANQGIQKMIPIQNHTYKAFYEFIRFIYTDKCAITKDNVMGLLELSVKYKIPKLENMVIAYLISNRLTVIEKLKVYEFCETENYPLLRNWISKVISPLVPEIIKLDHFNTIQPVVMKSILNMDFMGTSGSPVKEVDLFNALIKWMNNHCKIYGIPLPDRRVKFDGLIRMIRFPIMMLAELNDCLENSDYLFTDLDYVAFFKSEQSGRRNCTARHVCSTNNANTIMVESACYSKLIQKFETSEKLVISGLRFTSPAGTYVELLQWTPPSTKITTQMVNMQVEPNSTCEIIVSFGESFVLRPGTRYAIKILDEIKSKDSAKYSINVIKDSKTNRVQEEFASCYKELESDPRIAEIFFKTA